MRISVAWPQISAQTWARIESLISASATVKPRGDPGAHCTSSLTSAVGWTLCAAAPVGKDFSPACILIAALLAIDDRPYINIARADRAAAYMASFNAKRMESISGSNSYPGPGSTPSSFGTSKRLGCTIKCLLILVSFSQMQSIGNAQTPGQTEMGSDTSPEASGSAGTTLKMSSALSSFDIVVALDIGTAETGSAFFVKEQPNVYLAGLKGMKDAVKIPTTVLVHMSASGEPQGVAFGDDAIEEYENMKNDDGGKYALFERFKMRMFNEKGILVSRPTVRVYRCLRAFTTADPSLKLPALSCVLFTRPLKRSCSSISQIPAADGVQRLNIVQILAIWMRYLKQQLQFVLQSQGKELHLDRTLWVMTVPSVS